MPHLRFQYSFLLLIHAGLSAPAFGQSADPLEAGFEQPTAAARPYVWWHWMNGNVTLEGIEKDFDWFSEIGVGGFTAFDGAGSSPRFVKRPLLYMTPEWKAAFRTAMAEADRRGFEASIAASPGWSQTGGPWVRPEEAMKKYVWTETRIQGGRVAIKLPRPSDHAGGFQDALVATRSKPAPFYRDATVFAYRMEPPAATPTITASGLTGSDAARLGEAGKRVVLDSAKLANGSVTDAIQLAPSTVGRPTDVLVTYPHAVTMRGVTLATGEAFLSGVRPETGPLVRVAASVDGTTFTTVAEGLYTGAQRTFAFPAAKAKVFRITIFPSTPPINARAIVPASSPTVPGNIKGSAAPPPLSPLGGAAFGEASPAPSGSQPPSFALAELVMRPVAAVEQFEVKAGFGVVNDYYAIPTPSGDGAVAASDVVDLTGHMSSEGVLDWTAPPGNWTVVRLGYSLTGKENGPASEEATGLEVDKLNAEHVRAYVNTYLDMYASATGPELIGRKGLRAILNDSYEARYQNWTENMLGEFKVRRGYNPAPWLPVLTGVVVENAQRSDKFLWDWRRTIFDLLAQSHYKVVAEEAHKRGMTAYAEALEDSRAYHGDDMEMRQYADVPMSAIGLGGTDEGVEPQRRRQVDSQGAASVAHIYGRPIVAAEAFTGIPNDRSPQQIKSMADELFVHGVNRIFIHTSAHQPGNQGPGVTLNNIGFFFSRNEPWAGMAKPWMDYLARSSFMLQQGRYVADFAYFYGEEAPITGIWGGEPDKPLPWGRGYDFVNADVILNRLSAQDGQAVTPSGMRYPLVYVGGRSAQMTLPVLNKLRSLVEQGLAIAGERPTRSPSLSDDDTAFERAADALWGSGEPGLRYVGKGRVFVGFGADEALTRMGIFRDVDYAAEAINNPIGVIHRSIPGGEIFYVANRRAFDFNAELSFRVSGKSVELWDPVTGQKTSASYRTANGRTIVSLTLARSDSVFVVMRTPGPASRTVSRDSVQVAVALDGPWNLSLPARSGGPTKITLTGLLSLSQHRIPGVRYFSGVATYTKTLDLPKGPVAKRNYLLDLGEVHDIARVYVNGTELGTVWRPPFNVDVTKALRRGKNEVRIEVANTWKNRLIGDQQPGMTQVTFSPSAAERADTPLIRSGLVGPVRLMERGSIKPSASPGSVGPAATAPTGGTR